MSGPDNINSEVLSDVIGAIYDCALEPQRWQQTVKLINAFCDSPFGGLGIIDSRAVAYRNVYDDGYAAEFVAMYPKYEAMNPIFQAASLRDVGQVNTQAMLIDEVEFLESRYYRECLSTFGYRDLVGFLALKSAV